MRFPIPAFGSSQQRGVVRLAAMGMALTLTAGVVAGCGAATTPSNTSSSKSASTSSTAATSTSTAASSTTSSSGQTTANTASQYAQYFKQSGTPITVAANTPVTIKVGPGLTYTPNVLNVTKGEKVQLKLASTSALPHNFTLLATKTSVAIPSNKTVTASFTAPSKAGTYYFYCNIPGHAQAGMVGKIIVK